MKLSEKLRQDHECGDFGKALEGYWEEAAALEQMIEWISVEDELPPEGEIVIAGYWLDDVDKWVDYNVQRDSRNQYWGVDIAMYFQGITHWRRRVQPPIKNPGG